jgi:IS30 family transposase
VDLTLAGRVRHVVAGTTEWHSCSQDQVCLLAIDQKLRTIVASKLILNWSPEQISKWLKVHYPSNQSMRVSHETIYRSLFIQARGVLKKS